MDNKKLKCILKNLICKIKNDKVNNKQIICTLQSLLKQLNNKCNLKKLSCETNKFTEINGQTPPGILLPTQDSKVLLNTINSQGQSVLMVKSVRKAGTRVGIHVHRYGGYTLILSGEMTDFVQGQSIKKYGANSGYYMPPCTPMAAANLGDVDVELIDIFIGEPGKPFIEILEPAWPFQRILRFDKK